MYWIQCEMLLHFETEINKQVYVCFRALSIRRLCYSRGDLVRISSSFGLKTKKHFARSSLPGYTGLHMMINNITFIFRILVLCVLMVYKSTSGLVKF